MANSTHAGIELINLLDRGLNVTRYDGISYFDSVFDILVISRRMWDVRFGSKLFCCSRITFIDQIVHDNEIKITRPNVSHTHSYQRESSNVCGGQW